jgi:hypothetical protein
VFAAVKAHACTDLDEPKGVALTCRS